MGKAILMLNFLLGLLFIFSIDCIFGFALFLIWKYLDLKYFSISELEQLKEENDFLKKENKKVGGISTIFWSEKDNISSSIVDTNIKKRG